MSDFINEFMNGQLACQKGEQCPVGASEEFKRGYGAEYEWQQVCEHNPKLANKARNTK